MEDDGKNLSETSPVYSSSLLTNWLYKYKTDNISYLSSPQSFHAHVIKSSRRGGGIFDSRDLIRPTVQLFKVITYDKKRNETPSPQRNKSKGNTTPSPAKESNRIFNHKTGGKNALDNYRKIYTYGRVKLDKVSRDKIESAVSLYRQREQEKENTASKYPPEKNKRRAEIVNFVSKTRMGAKLYKPTIIEKKHNLLNKSEEKIKKDFHVIKNKKAVSGESKKNETKQNETKESNKKGIKRRMVNSLKNNALQLNKNSSQGNSSENDGNDDLMSEEGKNKDINILNEDKNINKLNFDKELLSSKSVSSMNKINSDNDNEKVQINVMDLEKKMETEAPRASLIRSLKAKSTAKFAQTIGSTDKFSSNKNILTGVIIKPAFTSNSISAQNELTPKTMEYVDDLIRQYRIKYRNMIKLR